MTTFCLHFLTNYPPPLPYLLSETLPGVGAPAGVLQQGVCRGRPQGRGEENTQQPQLRQGRPILSHGHKKNKSYNA